MHTTALEFAAAAVNSSTLRVMQRLGKGMAILSQRTQRPVQTRNRPNFAAAAVHSSMLLVMQRLHECIPGPV